MTKMNQSKSKSISNSKNRNALFKNERKSKNITRPKIEYEYGLVLQL